ncbi:hypothetical protein L6452_03184 [Arctium lappa]|uniref:Uncharacterized protein n=1 Tax=Arctium lappa TaxID=4217 RepID=A0ACB9FME4_ARCLA|nr:hypothetical protein L6452_03184 [Arctium lappa]
MREDIVRGSGAGNAIQSSSATKTEEAIDLSGTHSESATKSSKSSDESSDSDGDDDQPSSGEIRRAERALVENENVRREKQRKSKHNSERTRVMRQPTPIDLPLTSSSQCLEPLDDIFPLPRTRVPFSATAGGLSGPAGTPIVIPTSVGLRGLGGSPTTTIITPAVPVDGATSTVVTTTGSLSDPGASYPEFFSREFLDGALKAVHSVMRAEMREEVDALKRMIKGKAPMSEPEPLPPTPPPSHISDLSINDLKSMLLAKLLAQSQT